MPINVFGNSSNNSENKIDTSLIVQKPYLRTNYIDTNIEEDIDKRNQFRIKKLPDPISNREAASKNEVNNKFNDPSIIENSSHIDLNDKNITNAGFIQVIHLPQIDSHLTAKLFVDNAISYGVDEQSLLRLDADEKLRFDVRGTILLNSTLTSSKTVIEVPTNLYVDWLHENSRNRRDLSTVFNDQDSEFDTNKLTNLDSVVVKRNPSSDNKLANKKYVDDSIGVANVHRFNQTLENFLKVSVGNDVYNFT